MNILDIRNVINSTKFNNSNVDIIKFNGQEVWTAGYWLTKSGYPLTLTNSLARPLKDIKIYGNSIQDGTPTPDNPVEIKSVGDKTDNLIDYKQFTSHTANGITFIENGVEYTGSYYIVAIVDNITSGDTYVMSFNMESTDTLNPYWRFQYTDKTYSKVASNGVSITIPTDKTVEKVLLYPEISATVHTTKITNIQLLQGSTVKPYEPYGYKIPIEVKGNNLFSASLEIGGLSGFNGTNFNNTTRIRFTDYIEIEPNTIYTYSFSSDYVLANSHTYDENYNHIGDFKKNSTTSSGARYAKISFKKSDDSELTDEDVEKLLSSLIIVKGTTITDYAPYVEPITTNIYLDEPLRKIGDYADYIDFKNKKIVRNIGKHTFNGSEVWVKTGDTLTGSYQGFAVSSATYNVKIRDNNMYDLKCLSDRFPYNRINVANCCQISSGAYGMRIIASVDIVPNSTTSEFKEWLNKNNTTMWHPLETPEEETIELPSINATKGTCIISCDTTIVPSNMSATYKSSKNI